MPLFGGTLICGVCGPATTTSFGTLNEFLESSKSLLGGGLWGRLGGGRWFLGGGGLIAPRGPC